MTTDADPGVLADAVRAAVLAVPGIAAMHRGAFGEVATYLPGRRVEGVRLRPDRTEVHVVVRWGAPALATAEAARAAAAAVTGTPVDVHVQDLTAPAQQAGPGAREAPRAPLGPIPGDHP